MIVVQRGVVDITPEYNRALRPVFCVSEGDKTSRQIVITVMQNGEAFLIPSGSTVYIIGKKSDSTIFTYRCNYSGSDVSFDITEQMSAASGIVLCELQINLSGQVLGSANFVYWTEPTPVDNGTYSESDLNIMLEAIAGAERLDNFYAGIEDMVAQAVEQIQIMPGQVVIDPTLLVNGAAADAAATGNAVRSFLNALITETTPTAAIATCDDAAGGLPLKKLTANIAPAQAGEGDPSTDNVRPISGYTGVTVTRTGKNLIDPTGFERANVFTANADGSYTFTKYGKPSGGVDRITNICDCRVKAGQTVTFSADITGVPASGNPIHFDLTATVTGSIRGSVTCTVSDGKITGTCVPTEDTIGARLYWQNNSTGVGDSVVLRNIQVEYGEAATEYAGEAEVDTYSVTFPTAAGTVYGGTLNVYDDGSGTLTVDRGCFTSEEFSSHAKGGTTTFDEFFFRTRSTQTPAVTSLANTDMICSHAVRGSATGVDYTQCRMSSGQPRIIFPVGTMPSLSDFDAWLSEQVTAGTPLQFSYILAAPTTYALSAVQVATMLNGVNNIWTDTAGTLTAEYYASTGLYVEKKVNAQRNMIAGVEAEMIATKNYAIGDLLIVGNTLYKVTAAISSGAALVVGTNVTETTVAEQLLALA